METLSGLPSLPNRLIMKNLILLILLVSGCVTCPNPCQVVQNTDTVYIPCDTAQFEAWSSRKDSALKARAMQYADSVFAERNKALFALHDSLKRVRNNVIIYGDSTRIKRVGFDSITKMPVIIYE